MKNTRAEAANCLNGSLRNAATQPCSQWMVPSWESSPLFCRLARQCTALCQNICAINFHCVTWKYFHLSSYYLKAMHWQEKVSSDKLGRLEQPLLFPPICDLYSLQFSFPVQHKSGDLRLFNNICQVTMSSFKGTVPTDWNQPDMLILPHAKCPVLLLSSISQVPTPLQLLAGRGNVSLKNLMPAIFRPVLRAPGWGGLLCVKGELTSAEERRPG